APRCPKRPEPSAQQEPTYWAPPPSRQRRATTVPPPTPTNRNPSLEPPTTPAAPPPVEPGYGEAVASQWSRRRRKSASESVRRPRCLLCNILRQAAHINDKLSPHGACPLRVEHGPAVLSASSPTWRNAVSWRAAPTRRTAARSC